MYREDYILRIIREAGEALRRILGLREAGDCAAAQLHIDRAYSGLLGLSSAVAGKMHSADLLRLLSFAGKADGERVKVLAQLLKVEGDVRALQGRTEESRDRYLKALDLLLEIGGCAEEDPREFVGIDAMVEQLEVGGRATLWLCIPAATWHRLFSYYETSGRYGRAEDLLFAAVEAGVDDGEIIDCGTAFYQRLGDKDDAELAAGNLTRDELAEGQAELASLRQKIWDR